MLVTRSIVNLNLNSFLLDVFGATVNIENCWLVSLGKRVLQIVCDEGGLTYLSVPNEHELKMLHTILRSDLTSRLRWNHRLWLKHLLHHLSHRSCLHFFLLWRSVFWHLWLRRERRRLLSRRISLHLLNCVLFLCRTRFFLIHWRIAAVILSLLLLILIIWRAISHVYFFTMIQN